MGYKYTVNEQFFRCINTEKKAYWLGFLLADGCVDSTLTRLSIGLSTKDRAHLEKFRRDINCTHPILDREIKAKYKSSTIVLYSPKLVSQLTTYNITPRKSLTAKPFEVRKNLQKHYWRGVFDGDGGIDKKPYAISLAGSIPVCESFCKWLISDLDFTKDDLRFYGNTHKNYATVGFTGRERMLKFLSYIYVGAETYLDRKYLSYKKMQNKSLSRCRYTEEEIERALEMHQGGLTTNQVVAVTGVRDTHNIIRWAKQRGIQTLTTSQSRWLDKNTINVGEVDIYKRESDK